MDYWACKTPKGQVAQGCNTGLYVLARAFYVVVGLTRWVSAAEINPNDIVEECRQVVVFA